MKKHLVLKRSFIAVLAIFMSCEDTLDTTVRPVDEIPAIIVQLENEQSVNPNDDSGLTPTYSTFVGSPVTFSSAISDMNVAERVWLIPQTLTASTLDFEEIVDMGPVTRSFSRPNNSAFAGESFGFPVILNETMNDGTINRIETQIQVRSALNAGIIASSLATINEATSIRAASAESMGLTAGDLATPGQVVFEWNFGNGVIDTPSGPASTFTSTDINETFNVVYDTATPPGGEGELVTLTVTRFFPAASTSSAERRIIVVDGLTPSRGPNRDAIKLSADGTEIIVGYEQAIGDISSISPSDYEIAIDVTEITDAPAAAAISSISVTNVEIDPDDPNNVLLTLSGSVPSILMDNVTISFSATTLFSTEGENIVPFIDSTVFPTGTNLLGNSSGFEDVNTWAGGGFFWPNPADTPELEFSTEQSLDGNTSMLFNSNSFDLSTFPNNFGIGSNIVEPGIGVLPVTEPEGEYVLSMWVYVESAESGTQIDFFLLDFAAFTTGAQTDFLPVGEWVLVTGRRNISTGGDIRALIRVLNAGAGTSGQGRIFVDQVDIRVVDDGR